MTVQDDLSPEVTLKHLLWKYHPSNMNDSPVIKVAKASLKKLGLTHDLSRTRFVPRSMSTMDIVVVSVRDELLRVTYYWGEGPLMSISPDEVFLWNSKGKMKIDYEMFLDPLLPTQEELRLFMFTYPDLCERMWAQKKRVNIIEGVMTSCFTKSCNKTTTYDFRLVRRSGISGFLETV